MGQLHVERDSGWNQQQTMVFLIVWEDREAICEAEGMKLFKLTKQVAGTLRHASVYMDLMKTVRHFASAFKNDCNQDLFAIRITDIVRDMMGSDVLAGMSSQRYHRYTRVAREMLSHESTPARVESGDGYDAGSNFLVSPACISLSCTRWPWKSCQFALEGQEALWRSEVIQHPNTPLHCMAAQRCFSGIRMVFLSITVLALLWNRLRFEHTHFLYAQEKQSPAADVSKLYVFDQLWPYGQGTRLKVSVWKWSAPDYLKRAEVVLQLWSCRTVGAANWKNCWRVSTFSSKAHGKDFERRSWRRRYRSRYIAAPGEKLIS